MVNALRLVKKQWFIVNCSEESQRFTATLYFWRNTSTAQFLRFTRQKLQVRLRTEFGSWSVLQIFEKCHLNPQLICAVLHMVSYGDSICDHTVRKIVWHELDGFQWWAQPWPSSFIHGLNLISYLLHRNGWVLIPWFDTTTFHRTITFHVCLFQKSIDLHKEHFK